MGHIPATADTQVHHKPSMATINKSSPCRFSFTARASLVVVSMDFFSFCPIRLSVVI